MGNSRRHISCSIIVFSVEKQYVNSHYYYGHSNYEKKEQEVSKIIIMIEKKQH